jgi:NADH:ubiquinone oxidoreductase subunit C
MSLVPNPEYQDDWLVISQLYQQNPGAWTPISHIHQNSAEEQPHLSVYYKSTHTKPIYVYYHIYGYIKNQFIITHITRQNKDKTIQTVAEFKTF